MCGCRARGVSEEGETNGRATHDDSAARDGGLDERVQLLVAADGQLQVARRDALHLRSERCKVRETAAQRCVDARRRAAELSATS
jgi:hypothetical protein